MHILMIAGLVFVCMFGGVLFGMFEGMSATVPVPFLIVVVCWLTFIFASFGLNAPGNATATVFLILELDTPFSGFMKVGEPLRLARAQLGP